MNIQNGVICGLSDWLYLQGGSNHLMDYHTGVKQLSEDEIESWSKTLQYRHEWHQARNINYMHVFAPNKICVYPEFYPEKLTLVGDRPIVQLIKNCGELFLYQLDYLLTKKKIYELYHKTDTHWNKIGAFFAYEQIMNLLDRQYNQHCLSLKNIKFFKKSVNGDLGTRFVPPKTSISDVIKVIEPKAYKVFDNGVANRGNIVKFKSDENTNGKLLIFGDSFTKQLLSFFSESFKEVVFVHAAFIDFDYVQSEKPDIVLSHIIERFIIKIPDDMNSPKAEEYASLLGK